MKDYIIGGLIGGVIVFVLLKFVMKAKPTDNSKTFENLKEVVKTTEARELIQSDEFKELMKTQEFKQFAIDFGTDQLINFIAV